MVITMLISCYGIFLYTEGLCVCNFAQKCASEIRQNRASTEWGSLTHCPLALV